jgi:2-C-methyl-D-erythritol 2,4-cyclodiphosphate synthase
LIDVRIGIGFDAHRLVEGVPLVLGGVEVDHPRGLAGHSDGDVLTHALIDALLGPAGVGDLGTLFPSDDPTLEGIASLDMLRQAYDTVCSRGYELVNADCLLIGEEPRIAPLRARIERTLAETLGVEERQVSVRATTTDRMGFTGRGEGLAAQAVALLLVTPPRAA